jgi:hypothetical protein
MESFLSIIGSLASLFGAFWSLREAGKAKRSADKAEHVRQELADRRQLAEVAQVQQELKRLLASVAKVGPASTQQLMKGLNCAAIASEVQAFLATLIEQRGRFSDHFDERVARLRADVKSDIESLAAARTFEERKRHGKNIYYALEKFAPVLKQLSDAKLDQASRRQE